MAQHVTMTGSDIIIYINNVPYTTLQSITLDVDYSEEPIFGIDSPWAQEVAGGRCTVKGSVRGLRIKLSGGLQGANARPLFTDLGASPYISIRIADRATNEDIALMPNAKVTSESHSIAVRSSYKLNFDFIAQNVLFALDRSDAT